MQSVNIQIGICRHKSHLGWIKKYIPDPIGKIGRGRYNSRNNVNFKVNDNFTID